MNVSRLNMSIGDRLMARREMHAEVQNSGHCLVVFTIQDQRYALRLPAVERVVQAVELTPLPGAPEIVLGVFNLEGRVVPVVDVRRRFHLPRREVRLTDQLLVAHTASMSLGLLADRVDGLIEPEEHEIVQAEALLPGLRYVAGIATFADGLILIHDLATFLSLEEKRRLRDAMGGNKL